MFTRVNILLTFDTVEEMQRAEGKLIACERENVSHFYGVDMSVEYVEALAESHEITIVASMEKTPDSGDAFVVYVYSGSNWVHRTAMRNSTASKAESISR